MAATTSLTVMTPEGAKGWLMDGTCRLRRRGVKLTFSSPEHCAAWPPQATLAALTPDGSTLVSTEEDGTLRVWDVKANP